MSKGQESTICIYGIDRKDHENHSAGIKELHRDVLKISQVH